MSTQAIAQLNCNVTNGDSYGAVTGIQAWTFNHSGAAGNFAGNSATNGDGDGNADGDISSGSSAWGLYANSGGVANQSAVFDIPFVTGDEIKLDMDNGYIDNGSTVGFGLQNANGENLLEFYFIGGETSYTIQENSGSTPTSIGFTDEGLSITLTLNSTTEVGVSILDLGTGTTSTYTSFLMAPAGGQAIKRIRLFNANAGFNEPSNAFFNNLEVCQSSTDSDNDGWFSDLDCDDSNFDVNPNATEVLFNNIDDDCNPSTLDFNSGIFEASVTLSQTYLLDGNNFGPEYFYAQDLGTYYCGDSYFLQGAECKTFKCTDNENADITSAAFHYRVYQNQQTPGNFTTINMPFASDDGVNFGCQDQTWRVENLGIDLLQGLESETYLLEVYTSAEYTYTNGSGTHTSYEEQNFGLALFVLASDEINPVPICQDFNLVLGQDGTGVLEIDDINNGSTDNCGIASMSLSETTFTCEDLPTEPYTSDEIIMSEYVHISNSESFLELFNGTPNPVNLADYELRIYVNGLLTPIATDNLGAAGTLEPNETVVFCRPNSSIYSGPKTELPNNSVAFRGRETVELFNNVTNQRVDLFGKIGEFPSPGFIVGGNSAILHTLRRLPSVTEGNVNAPAGFPTLGTEWEQFPLGDISGLGSHTFNYNTGEPSFGIKLFVTDETGNQGVCTSNVTFEIPLPAASCSNITIELDENGSATITPEDINDASTSSCSTNTLSASQTVFSCANVGDNTVTLTVTDENGFESTCDAIVTVVDNTLPTVVCQDISIALDGSGNATITANDVDNGSSDACGISEMTVSPSTFDINNTGANTVTLTVTDDNGNSNTCEAAVTITGNDAPPQAVCNNITVALGANGEAIIDASAVDGGSTALAGIASMSVSPANLSCSEIGENTVILTVTDLNGLSSTCESVVTVVDLEAPTAICQDASVTVGLNGSATLSIQDVNNGSGDNCAVVGLELSQSTFNCGDIPTETPAGEIIISEYIHGSVVNGNGIFIVNNYIEVFNVTPNPVDLANYELRRYMFGNTEPTTFDPLGAAGIIEPGETFVFSQFFGTTYEGEQVELENFTMAYNGSEAVELYNTTTNQRVDLIGAIGEIPQNGWNVNGFSTRQKTLRRLPNISQGITENLPGFPSLGTEWEQFELDDLTGLGAHESNSNFEPSLGVILTVTDQSGNTSTCSSNVTFNYEAPELSCTNTTLFLDEDGYAVLAPSDIDSDITTGCGVDTVTVSQSAFSCNDLGQTTVTLTVVDIYENTSTCESIVTIADNIAPLAACNNITVALDENGIASITEAEINNGSSDNCGIASVTISPSTFDCSQVGEQTVILTVTDNSGNVATCESTVTVVDLIPPTAICNDFTLALDEFGVGTLSPQDIENGSFDNCGMLGPIIASQIYFDCTHIGENQVTLTVFDENGNTSTCQSTVTVVGDIAPVALCSNITISLDENGEASIAAQDIGNGSSAICGLASVTASQTDFNCSDIGENVVTLTVSDINGNSSTCDAIVTVLDNNAPTAVCQNVTVYLDENGSASLLAADVDNGSTDICSSNLTLELSNSTFDCSQVGANAVTLSVTDESGNVSTCTSTVTVIDNSTPVAVCQSAVILLDQNGQASLTIDQINNGSSDNCGLSGIELSQTEFDCSHIGSNLVTLTATDTDGNETTCNASVTVIDNISPNAIGENLILTLDSNGEANITAADLDNGSYDNCGIASISANQTAFDCSDIGTNSVIMTATDLSGNSANFMAIVTVVDESAPELSCQNISIGLDNTGYAEITASNLVASAADNCSIAAIEITNGPLFFGCDDEGMSYDIEVTATDQAGNEAICIATVNVLAGLDSDGDGISDVCDFCFGDNSLGDSDGDGICDSPNICPGSEDLVDSEAECSENLTLTSLNFQANNGGIYCIDIGLGGGQITVSNGSTVRLSGSGNVSVTVQFNSTLEVMSGADIQFNSINVSWGANAMVVHSGAEVSFNGNFSPNSTVVNCGTITVERLSVNFNKIFINNNIVEITDDKQTSAINGDLTNNGYIHASGSMKLNYNGEIFNYCHIEIDEDFSVQRNVRNYAFINVGMTTTLSYNGRIHLYDGAMYQTQSNTISGRYIGYGLLNFVKITGNTTMFWNGRFDGSIAVCDVDGFENIFSPSPFTNGAIENCDVDVPVSECNPVGHESIPSPIGIAGTPESDSNDTSDQTVTEGIISSASENSNLLNEAEIKIWPNPTNGETTLMLTPISDERLRIELYSIDGSLKAAIFEGEVNAGIPHTERIDMSRFENGVYFIRIIQNDKVQTKKIVFTR